MSLLRVETEIYKPVFNEESGGFMDVCPYKPHERNRIHYQCRCKAGTNITSRGEFNQHIKSQTHRTFIDNYAEYYKEVDESEEKNRKLLAENELLKRKVVVLEKVKKDKDNLINKVSYMEENIQCMKVRHKKKIQELESKIVTINRDDYNELKKMISNLSIYDF